MSQPALTHIDRLTPELELLLVSASLRLDPGETLAQG